MTEQRRTIKAKIEVIASKLIAEQGVQGFKIANVSEALGVDETVIRYFYQTEAILVETIVKEFVDDLVLLLSNFVKSEISTLGAQGMLQLGKNGLEFENKEVAVAFASQFSLHLNVLLDFFVENRYGLRVLLSAATTKDHESITIRKLHNLFLLSSKNRILRDVPIFSHYKSILGTAHHLYIYQCIMPIINYATFYDEYYLEVEAVVEHKIRKLLLGGIYKEIMSHIHNNSIVFCLPKDATVHKS